MKRFSFSTAIAALSVAILMIVPSASMARGEREYMAKQISDLKIDAQLDEWAAWVEPNIIVMEEVFSVTSALIQADELGASLGPILRIQSDQFRIRRAQAAEKSAMEAPVKLLFPLICFFFPATFIMIFGPVFLTIYYSR